MGTNDYQIEFAKLATLAKDSAKPGIRRIEAAITLAELSSKQFGRFSDDTVRVVKRVLRDFHGKETASPKERKRASELSEYMITGKRPVALDMLHQSPEEIVIAESMTPEQWFAVRNRDVYAEPPQKHIFFPSSDGPNFFLMEKFPQWFKNPVLLTDRVFEDPYNLRNYIKEYRIINPNFKTAYYQWKERRLGGVSVIPDKQSTWFLRFVESFDADEWNALGTLVIDPALPKGRELRRREHLSGFVKPNEVDFAWTLFTEILLKKDRDRELRDAVTLLDDYYNTTPPNYKDEFDGLAVGLELNQQPA